MTSNIPKVSVIIPTYNREHLISNSIQSVLAQTYKDFELIIVDDGSSDNTEEVVLSFKDERIRFIKQPVNRGVSAARNTGIKAARGSYIAFLDSDDEWLPQKLELQLELLDSRHDIAIVCSDAYVFDNRTGSTISRLWHDNPSYHWGNPRKAIQHPLRELLQGFFITCQGTVVRRLVFTEVGYFDESLHTHEDWDMLVRIFQRFRAYIMDVPLFRFSWGSGTLSSNYEIRYPGEVAALNKAINDYSLSRADLRLLKKRLAYAHFINGKFNVVNGRIDLGKEKLLLSVRINPWHIGPYIYLALSLLGSKLVLTIKSWKKQLERTAYIGKK